MSKGGGGKTQTQVVEQRNTLPAWVESAGQTAFNQVRDATGRPLQQYTGQTIAGFTPDQTAAFDMIRRNAGANQGAVNSGIAALTGAAGFQPGQVDAQSWLTADKAGYINPFLQAALSPTLRAIEQQRRQAVGSTEDAALRAGAYGGSRHGVADALTNQGALEASGDATARLFAQGWDQAMAGFNSDAARGLQAGIANQGAGLQGAALRAQAGAGAVDAARAASDITRSDAQQLAAAGESQQALEQARLDEAKAKFLEQRDYDLSGGLLQLQALGMTPYSTTGSTTSTRPLYGGGNPVMGAIGGASAGAGLASTLALGGPAGWALGGLGAVAGLLGGR